jgi:hypothetical protein
VPASAWPMGSCAETRGCSKPEVPKMIFMRRSVMQPKRQSWAILPPRRSGPRQRAVLAAYPEIPTRSPSGSLVWFGEACKRAKFPRAGEGPLGSHGRARAREVDGSRTRRLRRQLPFPPRKKICQADARINRHSSRQPTRTRAQSMGFGAGNGGAANAPGFQKRDRRLVACVPTKKQGTSRETWHPV